MSEIKVITQTTAERKQEQEQTYQQFREYYDNTELRINEIFKLWGFTNLRCSGARYIRKRLREDGCNSDKRFQMIKRRELVR